MQYCNYHHGQDLEYIYCFQNSPCLFVVIPSSCTHKPLATLIYSPTL